MPEKFGARERGPITRMRPFVAFCEGELDDLERQMAAFFGDVASKLRTSKSIIIPRLRARYHGLYSAYELYFGYVAGQVLEQALDGKKMKCPEPLM